MVKEIAGFISRAIYDGFAEMEPEIYTNGAMQDVKPGSFSIVCLPFKPKRLPGSRYRERYDYRTQWAVHYFPKDRIAAQTECIGVGEKLMELLEFIGDEDGYLHGTDMDAQIQDDALTLTVSYNFTAVREREKYYMETLTQKGNVHG